jgi:hypothetical protein
MNADKSRVVVTSGSCSCHSIALATVHHRNFPELRAEGKTAAEGAGQLANQLARERASVGGGWRRDLVDGAIADMKDFLEDLERSEGGRAAALPACATAASTSSPHGPEGVPC